MEKNDSEKKKVRQFFEHEELTHHYLQGYDGCTSAQLLRMTHIERFTTRYGRHAPLTTPRWKVPPISCLTTRTAAR